MLSAGQAVGQHDGVGVPGYQGLLDEVDAWAGGVDEDGYTRPGEALARVHLR